jgi:hypothetical protein
MNFAHNTMLMVNIIARYKMIKAPLILTKIDVEPTIEKVKDIMKKLFIKSYEDWYEIPKTHILDYTNGGKLMRQYL